MAQFENWLLQKLALNRQPVKKHFRNVWFCYDHFVAVCSTCSSLVPLVSFYVPSSDRLHGSYQDTSPLSTARKVTLFATCHCIVVAPDLKLSILKLDLVEHLCMVTWGLFSFSR